MEKGSFWQAKSRSSNQEVTTCFRACINKELLVTPATWFMHFVNRNFAKLEVLNAWKTNLNTFLFQVYILFRIPENHFVEKNTAVII
jgi:hypothetical protein